MYLDKIMWFLAWPAMIVISYYFTLVALKTLKHQIQEDPLGEDIRP